MRAHFVLGLSSLTLTAACSEPEYADAPDKGADSGEVSDDGGGDAGGTGDAGDGGGSGDGGDAGDGGGAGSGPGGGAGAGTGGTGGDDTRDLSAYAGTWSGPFQMTATATDGSGLSDSCAGVLTFEVDPEETSGPPFVGAFTCSWEGPLTEMESLVDPFFAGGSPSLPDIDGTISYGPFQLEWTGTASDTEWTGSFSGDYAYDASIPQLPDATITGSWSATQVSR